MPCADRSSMATEVSIPLYIAIGQQLNDTQLAHLQHLSSQLNSQAQQNANTTMVSLGKHINSGGGRLTPLSSWVGNKDDMDVVIMTAWQSRRQLRVKEVGIHWNRLMLFWNIEGVFFKMHPYLDPWRYSTICTTFCVLHFLCICMLFLIIRYNWWEFGSY